MTRVVKHKDGDPRNNAIDNLELETKTDGSKNFSIMTGNGRIYRGDGSPLVPGPLVPVTVPYTLVRRQVAKVWKLYDHWQSSIGKAERGEENLRRNVETDYGLYMHYRSLVEAAIAGGPPAWKDEFILP